MFNSPILELAIGMIFFYLLLSLVCSALNEIVEAWLKNRAADLENGIRRLLDDESQARGFFQNVREKLMRKKIAAPLSGLAGKLYDHAFVHGLYLNSKQLPSYIPARNFALALMDIVAPGKSGAAGAMSPAAVPAPLTDLRVAVADPANVPSERLRKALLAIIDAAGDDASRVRENIESWYNSAMDRVSGWYKRRTQILILCLGIGIAVVLNADSVIVANTLWRNSTLRTQVAIAAEKFVTEKPEAWAARGALEGLKLPVGWSGEDDAHKLPVSVLREPVQALSWSLYQLDLHWLGWIITGLAISLGAPFWFDILNKFIVVRSTVKPEEKSPREASKD